MTHCSSGTGDASDGVAGGYVACGDSGVSISVGGCRGVYRDELGELVLAGPCPGDNSAGQLLFLSLCDIVRFRFRR